MHASVSFRAGVRLFGRFQASHLFRLLTAAALLFFLSSEAHAAQVGVKYNRPKYEYPEKVISDFERLQKDRIRAVMIALPWDSWEPWENTLDEPFIRTKLSAVLQYCYENRIRVILASHCSFWGSHGNWTLPAWIRSKPSYRSATSALIDPEIRAAHIHYLKRLIDATRHFPAVEGYNILNEPVVATKWYLENAAGRTEFDARWEGVFLIADEIKRHMIKEKARQFVIIGNGNADHGHEAFIWNHTGKRDLIPLWTQMTDRIAAQGIPALLASETWYPNRPSLRTEGTLTYTVLKAWKKAGSAAEIKTRWLDTADASAVTFDYDAVYEYEGLANAAVKDLQAFYVWRVGSVEGSDKLVSLLHHREGDSATPYYSALRDLASGVDSFEALGGLLPESGGQGIEFNPSLAPPAISKFWQGTGSITAQKENLPPEEKVESRSSARMILEPGQSLSRSVITAHWQDSGVTQDDSFTFWAYTEKETSVDLMASAGDRILRERVTLKPRVWEVYRVPFKALGLSDDDISSIRSVGFENGGQAAVDFLVDEFLIR